MVWIIEGHKNYPTTQREPFKPKWITRGDHHSRNTRDKPVYSLYKVKSCNLQLPPFFGPKDGQTYSLL